MALPDPTSLKREVRKFHLGLSGIILLVGGEPIMILVRRFRESLSSLR